MGQARLHQPGLPAPRLGVGSVPQAGPLFALGRPRGGSLWAGAEPGRRYCPRPVDAGQRPVASQPSSAGRG